MRIYLSVDEHMETFGYSLVMDEFADEMSKLLEPMVPAQPQRFKPHELLLEYHKFYELFFAPGIEVHYS